MDDVSLSLMTKNAGALPESAVAQITGFHATYYQVSGVHTMERVMLTQAHFREFELCKNEEQKSN